MNRTEQNRIEPCLSSASRVEVSRSTDSRRCPVAATIPSTATTLSITVYLQVKTIEVQ